MKFAKPEFLYLLFTVPFFYLFFYTLLKKQESRFREVFSSRLWNKILTGVSWGQSKKKLRVMTWVLFFVFLTLARPQWGEEVKEIEVKGLDIMIVLDVSSSMDVEDVVPSRLRKAKRSIKYLLERLHGDRVGLVVFAGSAFLASPLTTDYGYLSEVLEGMTPQSVQTQGTDIGLGLEVALSALERGAEIGIQQGILVNDFAKSVLLVSDGEDLEHNAIVGAKKIESSGIRLFVLGVGTEEGGTIPLRNEVGELRGYKQDKNTGTPVISKFNSKALEEIAKQGGGDYLALIDGEKEMDTIAQKMGTFEKSDKGKVTQRIPYERYQYPLFIAILLIFWELSIPAARKIMSLFLFSFFVFGSGEAQADLSKSYEVYQRNNKGVKAFEVDKVEESQREIGTALILNPDNLVLQFNQSVLDYIKKDSDKALRSLEGILRESKKMGDFFAASIAAYNVGVLWAEKEDRISAARSFADSIEYAQKFKDQNQEISERLEKDARKKIEQLFNQQSQSDQGDGGGEGKDKEDDKEKDNKENPSQSSDQPEYSRGDQKQPQKSQKLSPEDMKKILQGLSEQDKRLQEKMQKEQGPKQQNPGKDW